MSRKILVSGGLDSSGELLIHTLKNAGYDVVETTGGTDTLVILRNQTIDLFISEINMEGIDGISLLKIIKGDKDLVRLPVLILTTETDDDIITEGRLAGAGAWMTKPFQSELLISVVEKLLCQN